MRQNFSAETAMIAPIDWSTLNVSSWMAGTLARSAELVRVAEPTVPPRLAQRPQGLVAYSQAIGLDRAVLYWRRQLSMTISSTLLLFLRSS